MANCTGTAHVGYFLYILGDNVEDVLGRAWFAVFFLGCGVAGTAAQVTLSAFAGTPLSLVGASGAIAGVMAAYLLLFRRARLTFMVFFWQFKLAAIVWIGVWLTQHLIPAPFGHALLHLLNTRRIRAAA